MYHKSMFAGSLECCYCQKTNSSEIWPLEGDSTPFYFQEEPGEYSIEIKCPHCGETWFVVWDYYPGEFVKLSGGSGTIAQKADPHSHVYNDPQFYLALKVTVEEAIKSGTDSFDSLVKQASAHLGTQYDMTKLYPLLRRAWLELTRR